jgi:hypothetical protein
VVDAGDIDEASFLRGLREKAVQEPVRSPRARIFTLASAVAVLVAVLCVAWSILWVRRGGRSAKREAAITSETRAPV